MTAAAVGNQDTTAAVSRGLGWIYMVTTPPPPRRQVWNHPPNGAGGLWQAGQQQQGLSIPGWPFSLEKKRLRQDTYQQQGLSNPGVVIFTEKKRLRQAG